MSPADGQGYRDLARSLLGMLEVARHTLSEEAPSELIGRVTGHLGCGLSDVVSSPGRWLPGVAAARFHRRAARGEDPPGRVPVAVERVFDGVAGG